ncbi:STAS domain-containing protein [Kitasatospora aureofaciens]|uniref:STAS domain-containing protein n=1 Tax=Kitasatospora aureofaciens TaxID=1894 RepID=UPI001C45B5CA|nr:STAS domain-containing protein [Kitasatospora aureofaciens]MBV6702964.1 STAS domain-containing protein [Kitasatospora aureofaciens]
MSVRDSLAGPVLGCAGELDLDQVPVLNAVLHRVLAVRPVPPMLLLDLHEVTFMDSAGLNALLLARIQAHRQGTVVHLARPSERVAGCWRSPGPTGCFPSIRTYPRPGRLVETTGRTERGAPGRSRPGVPAHPHAEPWDEAVEGGRERGRTPAARTISPRGRHLEPPKAAGGGPHRATGPAPLPASYGR